MGAETIRRIGNKEYLYYIYYENKKRKEVCCGLISDPKSTKKLKTVRIEVLQKQKQKINDEIRELKSQA